MNALLLGLAWASVAQEPIPVPLGICLIDAERVSCWDEKGKGLPDLAAEVERRLKVWSGDLGIVQGRKNRFVVFRFRDFAYLSSGEGSSVNFYTLTDGDQSTLALARIVTSPATKEGTARFHLGAFRGREVEIPFRNGAQAQVEDARIEIGNIGPRTRASSDASPWLDHAGPTWQFTVTRRDREPKGSFLFFALGRDGKPISLVDVSGRPIEGGKVESTLAAMGRPGYDWLSASTARYAQIDFERRGTTQPENWAVTNVETKSIGRLRVRRIVDVPVTFGPLPLDPL